MRLEPASSTSACTCLKGQAVSKKPGISEFRTLGFWGFGLSGTSGSESNLSTILSPRFSLLRAHTAHDTTAMKVVPSIVQMHDPTCPSAATLLNPPKCNLQPKIRPSSRIIHELFIPQKRQGTLESHVRFSPIFGGVETHFVFGEKSRQESDISSGPCSF